MHRLWYDLRTASMFEDPLRETVVVIDGWLQDMTWRVVSRYAVLSGREVGVSPQIAYAIIDGLFLQALLGMHERPAAAMDRSSSRCASSCRRSCSRPDPSPGVAAESRRSLGRASGMIVLVHRAVEGRGR